MVTYPNPFFSLCLTNGQKFWDEREGQRERRENKESAKDNKWNKSHQETIKGNVPCSRCRDVWQIPREDKAILD